MTEPAKSPENRAKIVIRHEDLTTSPPKSNPLPASGHSAHPTAWPSTASSGQVPARSLRWPVLGAILVLGGAALALTLAWRSANNAGSKTAEPAGRVDEKREQGQRTLDYWRQAVAAVESVSKDGQTDNAAAITSRIRRCATAIETQPTLGVDPDAVTPLLQLAYTIREVADQIEKENSWEFLFTCFAHGFAFDMSPANEASEADAALKKQLNGVHAECAKVRVVLTDRYEVEFPPIR